MFAGQIFISVEAAADTRDSIIALINLADMPSKLDCPFLTVGPNNSLISHFVKMPKL